MLSGLKVGGGKWGVTSAERELKRSMRPGFAGIENELLYNPKTTLVFGDAKDTLTKMVAAVKAS